MKILEDRKIYSEEIEKLKVKISAKKRKLEERLEKLAREKRKRQEEEKNEETVKERSIWSIRSRTSSRTSILRVVKVN